uniref:Uncharacterized protein n=1 Tax=Glossina pallidipes TaxID=7398 RepID=A0A1A9ZGR0_GLOPL
MDTVNLLLSFSHLAYMRIKEHEAKCGEDDDDEAQEKYMAFKRLALIEMIHNYCVRITKLFSLLLKNAKNKAFCFLPNQLENLKLNDFRKLTELKKKKALPLVVVQSFILFCCFYTIPNNIAFVYVDVVPVLECSASLHLKLLSNYRQNNTRQAQNARN